MLRTVKVQVHELNPYLTCVLCGGYYIDATTIIECLHSFCKSCIVRYLESSKFCPICDVQVHKTRPMENIRPDETLQDLVYKLVPGLFTREMKKRREFYASNPAIPSTSGASTDSGSDVKSDKSNRIEEDKISISIEFSPDGLPLSYGKRKRSDRIGEPRLQKRYLLCPAAFTIGLLKKFLRMKLDLGSKYEIDVFHRQETLSDNYTLMDIAYIYTWRRGGPFRLFYAVYEPGAEPPPKKPKTMMIKTEETGCEGEVFHKAESICDNKHKTGTNRLKTGSLTSTAGSKKRGRKVVRADQHNSSSPTTSPKPSAKKRKNSSSVRQTVSYLLNCSSSSKTAVAETSQTSESPKPQAMSVPVHNPSQQLAAPSTITTLPVSLPLPPCLAKPLDSADTTSPVPSTSATEVTSKTGPVRNPLPTMAMSSESKASGGKTVSVSNNGTGNSQLCRPIIDQSVPTMKVSKPSTETQCSNKDSPTISGLKGQESIAVSRTIESQQGMSCTNSSTDNSVQKTSDITPSTSNDAAARASSKVDKSPTSKQGKPSARQKKVASQRPLLPVAKIKISDLMQSKGLEELGTRESVKTVSTSVGEPKRDKPSQEPAQQAESQNLKKPSEQQISKSKLVKTSSEVHTAKVGELSSKKEKSKKPKSQKAKETTAAKGGNNCKTDIANKGVTVSHGSTPSTAVKGDKQLDKGKPKSSSKTPVKHLEPNKVTDKSKKSNSSTLNKAKSKESLGRETQKQKSTPTESAPKDHLTKTTGETKQCPRTSPGEVSIRVEEQRKKAEPLPAPGKKPDSANSKNSSSTKKVDTNSQSDSSKKSAKEGSRCGIVLKRPPPPGSERKGASKSAPVEQTSPSSSNCKGAVGNVVQSKDKLSSLLTEACRPTDKKSSVDLQASKQRHEQFVASESERDPSTAIDDNKKTSNPDQTKGEASNKTVVGGDAKPPTANGVTNTEKDVSVSRTTSNAKSSSTASPKTTSEESPSLKDGSQSTRSNGSTVSTNHTGNDSISGSQTPEKSSSHNSQKLKSKAVVEQDNKRPPEEQKTTNKIAVPNGNVKESRTT